MSLSHDLKRLTGRSMHPDLLAAWVLENRERLIEALEMDELTSGPSRHVRDEHEPELPL